MCVCECMNFYWCNSIFESFIVRVAGILWFQFEYVVFEIHAFTFNIFVENANCIKFHISLHSHTLHSHVVKYGNRVWLGNFYSTQQQTSKTYKHANISAHVYLHRILFKCLQQHMHPAAVSEWKMYNFVYECETAKSKITYNMI